MTKTHNIAKQLLTDRFTNATDLGKRSTAAKRAATAVRQLLPSVGPGLSKAEHQTLTDAVRILGTIAEGATIAKQRKKVDEVVRGRRRDAALKVVDAAFADVTDPAGVVAMLATSGNWRTNLAGRGTYDPTTFDARDVKDIMGRERREALEYYAYRISDDSNEDVAVGAKNAREKFDQARKAIEVKYSKLIVTIQHALEQVQSSHKVPK